MQVLHTALYTFLMVPTFVSYNQGLLEFTIISFFCHDLNVWFRADTVKENYKLITLEKREPREGLRKGKEWRKSFFFLL